MWLATNDGFFSFSQLPDGSFAVRTRVRGDLENLQQVLPSLEFRCIAGSGEFGWEAIVSSEAATMVLASMLRTCVDGDSLGQAVTAIPGQSDKSSAYQNLIAELLPLQLEELGDRLIPDASAKARLEREIRDNIKRIAKQSCLVGVDAEVWDVTRISWTGEEWDGLEPIPGYCFVEAFENGNPPHDFIYVVSVRTGVPEFVAGYEGDMDTFDLTVSRLEERCLNLPESVPRP